MNKLRDCLDGDTIKLNVLHLIAGFFNKELTKAEQEKLDNWICESDDNLEMFESIVEEFWPLIQKSGSDKYF